MCHHYVKNLEVLNITTEKGQKLPFIYILGGKYTPNNYIMGKNGHFP